MSTLCISTHFFANAKYDKEDSASSAEMMVHDTRLVLADVYTAGWGDCLHFPDQYRLVPNLREETMKMSSTRSGIRTTLTIVVFWKLQPYAKQKSRSLCACKKHVCTDSL